MNDHVLQSREALRDAIAIAGSPNALAKKLTKQGVKTTRQGVEYWRDKSRDGVPPRAARKIAEMYKIPLYKLRSDIWPQSQAVVGS